MVMICCSCLAASAQSHENFAVAPAAVAFRAPHKSLPRSSFIKNQLPPVSRTAVVFILRDQPKRIDGVRLPEDYYARHCGYFCRLEFLTQKKTGIPLTFRLGDLRYVDYLEGKDR